MRGKKLVLGGLVLVLVGAGVVGWLERGRLQTWYCLRCLGRAEKADRAVWIDRVVCLGEPAVAGLLECLSSGSEQTCCNAVAAIRHLGEHWGTSDHRTVDLVQRLGRVFGRLSPTAQANLMTGMAGWFEKDQEIATGLVSACGRLLTEAVGQKDLATQQAALDLAAVLLRQRNNTEVLRSARELTATALRSKEPANRLRAVQLSLHPGLDMLDRVVGLLRDPSPDVRRAAILAVGPAEQVVREEGLLPGLHDTDPDVRRLTEAALRGRGLQAHHLELGRLLTHPQAGSRLRVLDLLSEASDLDPGLWLRRLSHDPSPAVRAAALRAMSSQSVIDLTDRIDQMSRNDPSPTVAQLAQYYLTQGRRRSGARLDGDR